VGDEHERVAEEVAARALDHEPGRLDLVHPVDGGGDEDVGRRALDDLRASWFEPA
jgi:hypothetical protein